MHYLKESDEVLVVETRHTKCSLLCHYLAVILHLLKGNKINLYFLNGLRSVSPIKADDAYVTCNTSDNRLLQRDSHF